MSRPKRYGHGKWQRKQLYAIVAYYRSVGRSDEWVAVKLGVGPRLVAQIYEYLEWSESGEVAARRTASLTAKHES